MGACAHVCVCVCVVCVVCVYGYVCVFNNIARPLYFLLEDVPTGMER